MAEQDWKTVDWKSMTVDDYKESVQNMMISAGSISKVIFITNVNMTTMRDDAINKYLNTVNEFLRTWESIGTKIVSEIRGFKGTETRTAVKYKDAQEYIYANYDYAAMLPFTDKVFQSVREGEMSEPEDVEEFKNSSLASAFKMKEYGNDPWESVGKLIEDIKTIVTEEPTVADPLEMNMYNAVRNLEDLNHEGAREVIFRATEKVVRFLCRNTVNQVGQDYYKAKLLTSEVINILEFISYTLAIYAGRLFVIAKYAEPYVKNGKPAEDKEESAAEIISDMKGGVPGKVKVSYDSRMKDNKKTKVGENWHGIHYRFSESAENDVNDPDATISDDTDKRLSKGITLFQRADLAKLRNPGNVEIFDKLFHDYNEAVGATNVEPQWWNDNYGSTYPKQHYKWWNGKYLQNTIFAKELSKNPLYIYIVERPSSVPSYGDSFKSSEKYFHEFDALLHNRLNGHSGTSTARHEFINKVKSASYGESKNDLKKLMVHLHIFTQSLMGELHNIISNNSYGLDDAGVHRMTFGDMKYRQSIVSMLHDFYREMALVILQKAAHIEDKINCIDKVDSVSIMKSFDINIFDPTTLRIPDSGYSCIGVPDTTRDHLDMIDIYAWPVYESLEMYDDYLRTLPEFKDSMYFSEAFSMSELMNRILSFIQGLIKKIQGFWNDKRAQAGIKWVKDHKTDLLNMKFTGIKSDAKLSNVPKYKDPVGPPAGFNNAITNLNNFELNKIDTMEHANDYIKSLYPNGVYEYWHPADNSTMDSKAIKAADDRYYNLILYYDNPESSTDRVPDLQTYEGKNIEIQYRKWIDTILGIDKTRDACNKILSDTMSAVNRVKQKMAAAKKDLKKESYLWMEADDDKKGDPTTNNAGDSQPDSGNTNPPASDSGNGQPNNQQPKSGNGDQNSTDNKVEDDKGTIYNHFLKELLSLNMRILAPTMLAINRYIVSIYNLIKRAYVIGSKPGDNTGSANNEQTPTADNVNNTTDATDNGGTQ